MTTNLRCVDDRDSVVQTYANNPNDITDGSIGENITAELVQERGEELRFPAGGFTGGDESEIGPEAIAYDEGAEEWVIIEAKTTTSTDAVGIGLLSNSAYDGDPQLSNAWIRNSLGELQDRDKVEQDFVDEIDTAIVADNVRKEVVFVREVPEASGRTLTNPRSDDTDISRDSVVGVDTVTVIELEGRAN